MLRQLDDIWKGDGNLMERILLNACKDVMIRKENGKLKEREDDRYDIRGNERTKKRITLFL